MTSPGSRGEPEGQRRADFPKNLGAAAGEGGADAASSSADPARFEDAETALGGADSVQKTSYVTGEGAEPEGAPRAGVIARTTTGGGVNVGAWVVGAIAAIIALVYALGVFR